MTKCQPCDGSGLLPTGQVCTACQGRGGEGGTVYHPEDEATASEAGQTAPEDPANDPKGQPASGSALGPDSGSTGANTTGEPVLYRYQLVNATEINGQVVEAGQIVNLPAQLAQSFPLGTFVGDANLPPEDPADKELDPTKVPGQA